MKSSSVALFALFASASASLFSSEPKVEATASFSNNPFSHVVNGEKNKISVVIDNKSKSDISIQNVLGSFTHPETGALLRNTTELTHKAPVLAGGKLIIPYTFYSEFKPQDTRLSIWVDYTSEGDKYRTQAYDSIVSIVEPPSSIFDLELLSTYALLLLIIGGGGYLAYTAYAPQGKKAKRTVATPQVSAPVAVTATTTTGYEEEWVPEHHLKTRRTPSRRGAASSGDESGPERKGKGKKRA